MDNQKAKDFTKGWEKCVLKAYLDSGIPPVVTIGHGSTRHIDGSRIQLGETITQAQADEMFEASFSRMIERLKKEILFPDLLSDNQWAALCSLVYNIGETQFNDSTLLKKLNAQSPITDKEWLHNVSFEFSRWHFDNGRSVDGLVNRRKEERELFLA